MSSTASEALPEARPAARGAPRERAHRAHRAASARVSAAREQSELGEDPQANSRAILGCRAAEVELFMTVLE